MTDPTRDLLIRLASHMAYMQGQLEAHHRQLDNMEDYNPEDYYWLGESVALRQEVADVLADGEVAELVPVAVSERPWEREGWCDEHGRCWFGWTDEPDASWSFCKPSERDIAVVSLPAHALPIPQQQESDNG